MWDELTNEKAGTTVSRALNVKLSCFNGKKGSLMFNKVFDIKDCLIILNQYKAELKTQHF